MVKCSKEVEVQTVYNSPLEKTLFQHNTMRDTLKYSSGRKSVPQSGWSDCLHQPDCTCSLVKLTAVCISPSSRIWGHHGWGTKPKLHDANMPCARVCSITDQQSKALSVLGWYERGLLPHAWCALSRSLTEAPRHTFDMVHSQKVAVFHPSSTCAAFHGKKSHRSVHSKK